MLRQTLVALAATASLMLGAGALTPALANYSQCDEQPNADTCPTYAAPALNAYAAPKSANATHRHGSSQKLGSPVIAAESDKS
jgi:hypothetical protein